MATKKVDHLRTQTGFPKLQNIALSYSNECGWKDKVEPWQNEPTIVKLNGR